MLRVQERTPRRPEQQYSYGWSLVQEPPPVRASRSAGAARATVARVTKVVKVLNCILNVVRGSDSFEERD